MSMRKCLCMCQQRDYGSDFTHRITTDTLRSCGRTTRAPPAAQHEHRSSSFRTAFNRRHISGLVAATACRLAPAGAVRRDHLYPLRGPRQHPVGARRPRIVGPMCVCAHPLLVCCGGAPGACRQPTHATRCAFWLHHDERHGTRCNHGARRRWAVACSGAAALPRSVQSRCAQTEGIISMGSILVLWGVYD